MRCMHPGCESNEAIPFGYARCLEHEATVRHDNPHIVACDPGDDIMQAYRDGYVDALRYAHNLAACEADGDNPGRDGAVSAICQQIAAHLLNNYGIYL